MKNRRVKLKKRLNEMLKMEEEEKVDNDNDNFLLDTSQLEFNERNEQEINDDFQKLSIEKEGSYNAKRIKNNNFNEPKQIIKPAAVKIDLDKEKKFLKFDPN